MCLGLGSSTPLRTALGCAGRLAVPVAHTGLRLVQQATARRQAQVARAADGPKETSKGEDSYSVRVWMTLQTRDVAARTIELPAVSVPHAAG